MGEEDIPPEIWIVDAMKEFADQTVDEIINTVDFINDYTIDNLCRAEWAPKIPCIFDHKGEGWFIDINLMEDIKKNLK